MLPFNASIRQGTPQDWELVQTWLEERQISRLNALQPQRSWTYTQDGIAIAFAALTILDGFKGILEALCTNPSSSPTQRDQAIDALVSKILLESRKLGLDGLIAWTKDKNTLVRSKKFGFVEVPEQLIALNLRSK